MAPRTLIAVAVGVCGSMALVGCSSGPSRAGSTGTTPASSTAPSSPTSTTPVAENLAVTNDVRTQLQAAGAAMNNLPASAYTGLVPGTTYYAYDTVTSTYWAGAGLVPSPSSTQAQVSVQDNGGYIIFSRPSNGAWTAHPVGLSGISGTTCPVSVPAAVLAVWNWAPGTCRPSH